MESRTIVIAPRATAAITPGATLREDWACEVGVGRAVLVVTCCGDRLEVPPRTVGVVVVLSNLGMGAPDVAKGVLSVRMP